LIDNNNNVQQTICLGAEYLCVSAKTNSMQALDCISLREFRNNII